VDADRGADDQLGGEQGHGLALVVRVDQAAAAP
jgi:hypothetical protein